MSSRRLKRTIREDDSDDDAVALKPGAGPVKSTPRKISIQSEDEDFGNNIDRGEGEDEERNEGSISLAREHLIMKIHNPPDEGNENAQVTNSDPVTASNPVELTPGNPHLSPAGIRNRGNSCRNRSKTENERRGENKAIAVIDLTSASARHESDGGELEDSEAELDNGSTPTQRLQSICMSRVRRLRWSGRQSECVVPESKLKGKGKANNENATSSRRECETVSSGAGGKGKGRSRSLDSFEAGRSSSSSPEVVRKAKGGRRIVSSDTDHDGDDDQHGEKWKPDSGPSTRLRARMTTYASPNPTTRSGRPRRAAASNAVNYALLHEGQPLHDDYDDERNGDDDERSDYGAQRRLSVEARRSTCGRRTKSKKRRVGFAEDNDNESDEWLELIEGEDGENASRTWKKRNEHEDHTHNHDDSYEEGVSHAELFHRQMMEDEQSDPDDHSISSLLNPARVEDVNELFCVYLEFIGKAVQGNGKGPEFMKKFDRNRQKFGAYRRAIKKFEDHICTARESIAGGGSWNQEFKSAVMTYPFVGFGFPMLDDEVISNPEPCTACHRRERTNMSVMYLAGNAYDSRQIWIKSRWDQLLPSGWEDPSAVTTARTVIREWLPMGATCRDKSHLYHTLLHYKLYLACKIRHKMDEECITPEMLKLPRFQGFRSLEKGGFDEMLGRAEWMARMKAEVPDFHLEHGLKAIRRWQSISITVVDKAEAKRGRSIDPTEKGDQSYDSDSTEEEHVIPPRSRSRSAKRGRYGHAFSSSDSDSDNPNDMSDFIVDG